MTRVWQNARANTVRHVMVCDVHFTFPKMLNFIDGIVRIYTVFFKNLRYVFILHLLTFQNIWPPTERCLASKVWGKNGPNFLYTLYKSLKKVGVTIFSFILGRFSFVSNATNFFIHSLNRFILKRKCLHVAGSFQSVALYATITGVNIIGRKVNVANVNGAGWSGSILRPQRGF